MQLHMMHILINHQTVKRDYPSKITQIKCQQ